MKKYALILLLAFLFSCSKKENLKNDTVILEYKYDLNKKKYSLIFSNNTNENLTLLIPNQLAFVLYNDSSNEALSNISKNVERVIYCNIKNYPPTKSSALLKKSYLDYFHENNPKYEFTTLDIKEKEKKQIIYNMQIDKTNNFKHRGLYTQNIPKMRDLLNQKPFLDIISQYLKFEHNYKLYLDDFDIKDSLIIKF